MFLLTKSKRHLLSQLLGIEAKDTTACKSLPCYLTYSSISHFFFHKSPHPWARIHITACPSSQVPGCQLTLHTSRRRLLTLQRQNTYHEQPRDRNKEKEKTLCPTPFPPPATVHLSREWKRAQGFHSHHRHCQRAKPGLPRCCSDNFNPHCIKSLTEKDRNATAHGNESYEAMQEARARNLNQAGPISI